MTEVTNRTWQERKEGRTNAERGPSPFEPPDVRTFARKEMQEEIGPAQMCSPSPCPLSP